MDEHEYCVSVDRYEETVEAKDERIDELEAENARLKKALEEIGDHDCEDIYSNKASCGRCRTCLANNALEGNGDD